MWTQLEQFMICDNIPQRDKENVVLLHVFKQYNEDTEIVAGCNFFYATNDDSVYGFGDNIHGCLGLGHNRAVDTPQLIPELCGKSFKQFVIGYDFVLAITDGNQIYSWGHNNRGQLTREITPSGVYLKPKVIEYFNDKNILQISCGSQHSLALSADGQVYGWGVRYRHTLHVPRYESIFTPYAIKFDDDAKIKSIYCYEKGSHAITRDGHVFSWGVNTHNQLGLHSIDLHLDNFFKYIYFGFMRIRPSFIDPGIHNRPRLVPGLINIKSICSSNYITFFLSHTGRVFYCGFDGSTFILTPINYTSHYVKAIASDRSLMAFSINNNIWEVWTNKELNENKTEFHNFIDYFRYKSQVTNGTLKRDYVIGNQIDVGSGLCADKSIYKSQYDELSQIGSGGFGTVFKVKHKCDGELYAIKKMNINDFNVDDKGNINELTNLVKVRSEYVVQYYSSWIERNELYIQMELCCYNLQNILEVKPQVFGRQLGQPMDCVEYFILCEIFRQILESVQYLHELNPQIIHRDLKPENILIAENVRNDRFVKLCDFGLAIVHDKRYNSPTSKKHTSDVGTIKYQAPEVNHSEKYGHKADIYSLALIGGDIFELDLYKQESKSLKYNSNKNKPLAKLRTILISMMSTPLWSKRPECSKVLSKYNKWSTDRSTLKNNLQFESTLSSLQSNNNQFFYQFLSHLCGHDLQ